MNFVIITNLPLRMNVPTARFTYSPVAALESFPVLKNLYFVQLAFYELHLNTVLVMTMLKML